MKAVLLTVNFAFMVTLIWAASVKKVSSFQGNVCAITDNECSDSKLRDYHALLTKSVSSLECNKQSLLIVLRQEISLQSLLDPSIAAVSMSRVFHFRNSTISR